LQRDAGTQAALITPFSATRAAAGPTPPRSVRARIAAFARLVREKIRSLPGVKDIRTSFTLMEVEGGGALPVPG
jgi:hypothetical protein